MDYHFTTFSFQIDFAVLLLHREAALCAVP